MEGSKTDNGFVEENKKLIGEKADDCECLEKCLSDCGFVKQDDSDDEDNSFKCLHSPIPDWDAANPIAENCKCTTTCFDCTQSVKSIEMCVIQPTPSDKSSISAAKNKLLGNALWRQLKPPTSLSYIPPVVSARRTDVVRLQLQQLNN